MTAALGILQLNDQEGGDLSCGGADRWGSSSRLLHPGVAAAVAEVEAAFAPLDILVNNAGVAVTRRFLEVTPEDYDRVLDTNLRGCFFVAQSVAKRMVARGGGSIINIASVLGQDVIGQVSPYCASKAGLLHLNRAMALELAKTGVRVNAIAPGFFRTELTAAVFDDPDRAARNAAQTCIGRNGEPEDLDGPLRFLCSDASRYVTGQVLMLDGGFTAK